MPLDAVHELHEMLPAVLGMLFWEKVAYRQAAVLGLQGCHLKSVSVCASVQQVGRLLLLHAQSVSQTSSAELWATRILHCTCFTLDVHTKKYAMLASQSRYSVTHQLSHNLA